MKPKFCGYCGKQLIPSNNGIHSAGYNVNTGEKVYNHYYALTCPQWDESMSEYNSPHTRYIYTKPAKGPSND